MKNENHLIKGEYVCGFSRTLGESVETITSPGYPNLYPNDLECHWYINSHRKFSLIIEEIDIENQPECGYDYLDIFEVRAENETLLRRLCGKEFLKTVEIESKAHIVFSTDLTFQAKGFDIKVLPEIHPIHTTNSEISCSRRIKQSQGRFSSPGYPKARYPLNMKCTYDIEVGQNDQIFLRFMNITLEKNDKCEFDYVAIYDGPSNRSPLLGKVCQPEGKTSFKSRGNKLHIEFVSDIAVNDVGFYAMFHVRGFLDRRGNIGDCTLSDRKNGGTVKSPNFPDKYPSNAICEIFIRVPIGHTIEFAFEKINIEQSVNCTRDFIIVADMQNKDIMETPWRFCGSNPPAKFPISTNISVLNFFSDSTLELEGFELSYTFVPEKKNSNNDKGTKPNSFVHVSPNATVQEGNKHAITCISRKNKVQIQWYKESLELTPVNLPAGVLLKGSTLQIQRMNRNHAGNYVCKQKEKFPNSSIEATISLAFASKIQTCDIVFKEIPKDVTLNETSDFKVLSCKTTNESAVITWEKDGLLLDVDNNKKFKILANGLLLSKELEFTDEGLYTCQAKTTSPPCSGQASAVVLINRRERADEVCGVVRKQQLSQINGSLKEKIIGGSEATPGSHPWQVMFIWAKAERSVFCGGALLNDRWIVSAAHCFIPMEANTTLYAYLGKTFVDQKELNEIKMSISEIVIHPRFKGPSFDSDLALLKLKQIVRFTETITPICLGDPKIIGNVLEERKLFGTVTGWGITEYRVSSNVLREIDLPIADWKKCKSSTIGNVTLNMFCAGFNQTTVGDSCQGDSGGPLSFKLGERRYIGGVVSWGEGCAQKGKYGFYTNISKFYKWIQLIINSN